MSPITPIHAQSIASLGPLEPPVAKGLLPSEVTGPADTKGFGGVIDGLIGTVEAKQDAANTATRKVLLGDSANLHESVIAMQEASVAFTMMVEVRNKLVESYQELMRMQV